MKTVLVSLHAHPSPQAVPLATAFLASYLLTDEELSRKVSVVLLDFFTADSVSECVAAILSEQPDAVGFSMYAWNRRRCTEIAAALSREPSPPLLFAGGPEPTADAERVLEEAPFGFVVRGEGEIPFLKAMALLQEGRGVDGIRGVVSRGTSGASAWPEEPAMLDTIPSPYLHGRIDPAAYPGILWQLSRGCEFGCDFCFDHRGKRGSRRFAMERIKAELELFVRRGVSQIFVLDSTFNHNPRRAKEVLRLARKIAPHIHFHFEIRSEFIDREMAQLFSQVNCSLQIGLQSADPQVQKQVGRSFDSSDFTAKVSLLNETGAIFGFDLMYGLPGDTFDGFARSVDFAFTLFPNHLDIFPLAVLPGTTLREKADLCGLEYLHTPPYTLLHSLTFSAGDMAKAAGLAAACDIFYSRGKAVAWFNALLAPLGACPSAFLQNFHDWLRGKTGKELDEGVLEDDEIWRLQREFLQLQYRRHRLDLLLPAALDLVDYHHHYAAALMAPAPALPTDRQLEQTDLLSLPLSLAPSTRLATFTYEIIDYLEAGDIDLEEFTDCFSPAGSSAAIYPRAGEVFTESLDDSYFALLKHLDGETPARDIVARLHIPPQEAVSFLEFAAAEGIILLPDAETSLPELNEPHSTGV